ncbi:unnamed protein product [Pneumocystis jirovecii]|uniref:Palmitoyltransferase n=1 Tax=Pneumocystis jirovecii TaxID=42068 RepID=L0PDN4_PNEJI|nr:unnamed protein product [Pneumocystis jirovecii]
MVKTVDGLHCRDVQQHGIVLPKSEFVLAKLSDEKALGIGGKYENQQAISPLDMFFMASKQGNLDLIEHMCKSGEIMPNVLDDQGVTALHWASINDHVDVVRYLVLNGVDVNAQDGEFHATPLHWAAKNGNLYTVHMLLHHGACLHFTDVQGFTALHLATHCSSVMLVLYLLHQNIQVDCLDDNDRTPLIWAAYNGDELIVDMLLRWGADVKLQDKQGMTALHWAIVKGNKVCIKRLVEAGSDVFAKEYNGKTPERIAKEMNCYGLWKRALYEAGRDASGNLRRRLLTSKSSNMVLFFGPFFVIGFLIWILTAFFVKIISIESDPLFVIHKTKYLSGIFFGTLAWVILRWIFVLLPTTWELGFFLNILLFIVSSVSIVCFFYTVFSNPGYIPKPQGIEEQREIIEHLVKEKLFMIENYCIFCYLRRPLRSRHCKLCSRCVARFDHHCPWAGNCIGLKNHKSFIIYIVMLQIGIVLFIRLLFIHYGVLSISGLPKGCFVSSELLCKPFLLDSFTTILALWVILQFVWVMLLLAVQFFQISLSITTNEARNLYKYGFMNEVEHNFRNGSVASRLETTLNNQCSHYHYFRKKKNIFWTLLKFLGVYHFLKIANIFALRFTLVSNRVKNPFNNGVLSNCRDFWCTGVGKNNGLGVINTTKQSYNDGFGYIKGHLVNYYYLYDFFPFHEDLNKGCRDVLLDEI